MTPNPFFQHPIQDIQDDSTYSHTSPYSSPSKESSFSNNFQNGSTLQNNINFQNSILNSMITPNFISSNTDVRDPSEILIHKLNDLKVTDKNESMNPLNSLNIKDSSQMINTQYNGHPNFYPNTNSTNLNSNESGNHSSSTSFSSERKGDLVQYRDIGDYREYGEYGEFVERIEDEEWCEYANELSFLMQNQFSMDDGKKKYQMPYCC